MTIEMGDSAGDEEMEYSFCRRWTEGSPGQQLRSRMVRTTTSTDHQPDPFQRVTYCLDQIVH